VSLAQDLPRRLSTAPRGGRSRSRVQAASVPAMSARLRLPSAATVSRVERLVERAMTFAVEEYDDELAVARLAWLAHDDQAALDQACDVCLSYTEVDLGIRGRAIGLLARVLHPDLPPDAPSAHAEE
jgi:hypothetical protein